MFAALGEAAELSVKLIMRDYALSESEAKELFKYLWIFTYGVSALCATGMCDFSEDELINMLGNEFIATIRHIKSGPPSGGLSADIRPEKRGEIGGATAG